MHTTRQHTGTWTTDVRIPAGGVLLDGELSLPQDARGIVLFAHGSGSGRHSPRNQFVARALQASGIGTLLFDLLTVQEEQVDLRTRHLRFDIEMLAQRLAEAARWLDASAQWLQDETGLVELRPGFFGASTGGGAALVA